MRRVACTPREGWQKKVEEAGLIWHSGQEPYWDESAFYELTAKEVEVLETATNELEAMTLAAAQHIIDHKLYSRMGIPENAVPLIEGSWEAEPPALYGRFDLAYDGANPPKLLEYNADTPTALLEAAVVQWYWLQDTFPKRDQFNSIHERLIALWKELTPYLPGGRIDFCSMDDLEDGMTVTYLEDTARQAGLTASSFPIAEIGWDGREFVGPDDRPLGAVFKLYPWEWMVREEFSRHLPAASTIWIEPPWKMLLSNKGLLPVLWSLYPRHPYLLEASFDSPGLMMSWVKKPLLGREGANITLHRPGMDLETGGEYGAEGFIYQEAAGVTAADGCYAVIGSWLIGHEPGNAAAGIGIRESDTPITSNTSRFVPHLFD
ncbi:MAG TPA: glutathionylspermidine synthase family protein [Candidatus Sulfopaludibacter sp.]|nr:glutathionylspermidine synthase family protein [Candidatus Sulfopaludibacter sp.]